MRKSKTSKLTVQTKSTYNIFLTVGLILVFFLLGNFFIDAWNWGPMDFVIIAFLLLAAGFGLNFATTRISNPIFKFFVCVALLLLLFLIWAELAVDAVSQMIYKL